MTGHRVRLTRIVVIALIVQLVAIAVNGITTYVTQRTHGLVQWTVVAGVAVLGAVVVALVEAFKPEVTPPGEYAPRTGRRPAGSPPQRRGTPAVPAILVVLLVVGAGGFALSLGARYAVGYVTGNESGPDWLAHTATGSSGDLSLVVSHVYYTTHFTRVELTVENSGNSTLSLPLFGYCLFTGEDGTTLQADPSRSDWSTNVPPGARQRGIVTFEGKLPETVTAATFSFTTIFGQFGGGALTVSEIVLRRPP